MNWKRALVILAFLMCVSFSLASPLRLAAQEPVPQGPAPQGEADSESSVRTLWTWLQQGAIAFSARWRFEGFERDGAPFTGTAYAPTLRLALGYETPVFYGFSAFAQGEAVIVTGPADYSDPTLPSQNRPNLPAILDPKSLEPNQFYINWARGPEHKHVSVRVGRQELALNEGRFLASSNWRQVHGSFDAAKINFDLPRDFSFSYTFINHFYREVGYDAIDGHPRMHTDVVNLVWTKQDRVRASLYALLLDYQSPAQFSLSTQTYGLRFNGPYLLSPDWRINYTAEFAKQKNYGTNPYHVNENYFLGELGPGWRWLNVKAGYAFLGGRSATDLLTTPLSPPFNGWTDLFFNDPSEPAGNGLRAAYINASAPIPHLDGTVVTFIYYDYNSDFPATHYGSEFDSSLAYRIKKFDNRWEVGWRFGRYWADHLYTNAVRTSVYTSFTL